MISREDKMKEKTKNRSKAKERFPSFLTVNTVLFTKKRSERRTTDEWMGGRVDGRTD